MSLDLDHPRLIRALLALSVTLVATQAAVAPLWDADLWWILRAGEDALERRAVPTLNEYSFTAPDHAWVMHEWLLGALSAALSRALGLPGVALLRVAATLTVAAFALKTASRAHRPAFAALCVVGLFGLFGARFESARPIGLSYAPAMIVAWSAFAPVIRARHALAALVATLAWTNGHGSFPLALALLATGAVERRTRRHLALCLAAFGLTFVNPYGARMHGLVLRYLDASNADAIAVAHARIVEWWPLHRAPTRMYSAPELLGFFAVLALWIRAAASPRWRPRALLGLCLCAMALRHQRHLQLAGVISLPLLAETLARGAGRSPRVSSRPPLLIASAVALVAWGVTARGRSEAGWINPTSDPADFARIIRALPSDARPFVTLPFAGYALYLRGPRVFFDARNDCYPAGVLRDALDLDEGLLAPNRATAMLNARQATHAIAWCAGRASISLQRSEILRREGRLCLWRVDPLRR